jgi:predicted GIY-YIG superfamily endonuclease
MGLVKSLLSAFAGRSRPTALRSALSQGRMRRAAGLTLRKLALPPLPGLYRILGRASKAKKYIGQTDNLQRRIRQHKASGLLNLKKDIVEFRVARAGATRDDLCHTEVKHIKKHRPRRNRYRGGNGRR